MSIGSRVGLVVLFCMGFFICLTTALRMATLPLTLKTKEPSWESAPTNLWSYIESATGVICACLISLRQSIGALWPQRWRSRKGTASAQYKYGYSDGRSRNGMGGSYARGDEGANRSAAYRMVMSPPQREVFARRMLRSAPVRARNRSLEARRRRLMSLWLAGRARATMWICVVSK
jgi:hypothetical protein